MSRYPPIPRSYEEASSTLGTRFSKYVAPNTELTNRSTYFSVPTIVLRFHGTNIVIYQEGLWEVHTGGYYTQTTKDRISQALPLGIRIWKKEGRWYLGYEDASYTFAEGMKITKVGECYEFSGTGPKVFPRADRRLKRRILEYSKLCAESIPLLENRFTCPQCEEEYDHYFLDSAGTNAGHLDSHIAFKEIPLRLLHKAMNNDYLSQYCYDASDGSRPVAGYRMDQARREIQKSVQKYLQKRFGFLV